MPGGRFKVLTCGCHLPRWKHTEWREFENGHRLLFIVGYGKNGNGNTNRKRKYGRYYTHRAIQRFIEKEYKDELKQFQSEHSSET
jgi:hypothetical protein